MNLLSGSFIDIKSIHSVVFHYLKSISTSSKSSKFNHCSYLYNQPALGSQLLKDSLKNKKETVRRVLSGNVCAKGGSTFSFWKCTLL